MMVCRFIWTGGINAAYSELHGYQGIRSLWLIRLLTTVQPCLRHFQLYITRLVRSSLFPTFQSHRQQLHRFGVMREVSDDRAVG